MVAWFRVEFDHGRRGHRDSSIHYDLYGDRLEHGLFDPRLDDRHRSREWSAYERGSECFDQHGMRRRYGEPNG
jgi:hypothetical protein